MRWYFAIDEPGANGPTGEDAKTAVRTATLSGGLEPYLLYYGNSNGFTQWMQRHGVIVIPTEPGFIDAMRPGAFKGYTIGHWLRTAVPLLEKQEEYVLYTDCDVTFLKQTDWRAIRPKVFAAAPEFKKDNWNYFNSGVMVLNIPRMRETYPQFEALIRARISDPQTLHYDDQIALNQAYKPYWEPLDIKLNWKPYWGFKGDVGILHFHGPKLAVIEAILSGTWDYGNQAAAGLANILDGHIDAYISWLSYLGDYLQILDFPRALRMQAASSKLITRKAALLDAKIDLEFMSGQYFTK